jgi:3-hydroxyisobutyrate dehydrogenase-like beta-hydroxyacid dehydrogenase
MDKRIFDAKYTTLGFIGSGNMGSRMVRRLLAAGYRVRMYDREPSRAAALEKDGATTSSVEQIAKQSDVLISCCQVPRCGGLEELPREEMRVTKTKFSHGSPSLHCSSE